MKYVTIIGSRSITVQEENILKEIAQKYHNLGYILRSGGANGADSIVNEFENKEIYIPWNGFNNFEHNGESVFELSRIPGSLDAIRAARRVHPAPHKLTMASEKLHGRNYFQVFGQNGIASELVLFVADEVDGEVCGGTRTAVTLAREAGIETINLRKSSDKNKK